MKIFFPYQPVYPFYLKTYILVWGKTHIWGKIYFLVSDLSEGPLNSVVFVRLFLNFFFPLYLTPIFQKKEILYSYKKMNCAGQQIIFLKITYTFLVCHLEKFVSTIRRVATVQITFVNITTVQSILGNKCLLEKDREKERVYRRHKNSNRC